MNFRRPIIIAELWRPKVARLRKKYQNFCIFWKTHLLRENFQNSVPKGFTASLVDVLRSNFVKFGRQDNGKVVRYLPDKKQISPGSPALVTVRIVPKICKGQPQTMYSECSRFHPNRFTFGGVIVERVNTVWACSKVNAIFGWSLALSRIKNVSLINTPRVIDGTELFCSVLWYECQMVCQMFSLSLQLCVT